MEENNINQNINTNETVQEQSESDVKIDNNSSEKDNEAVKKDNKFNSFKNIKNLKNIDMKDKLNNLKNIDVNKVKDSIINNLDNISTFKNINQLNNEKKFFGFIIIVFACVILAQGLLNYGLITANRTIVLPPAVTKEFWATDKQISESYFEQVGFYIADRVLSVSPETVDSSYISLLPFFDSNSKSLKVVREKLREQAEFVKSENLYQIFYPLKMTPDYANNKITIEGPMKKFIGEMLVQETKSSQITINYEIVTGRFMIKSLNFEYK